MNSPEVLNYQTTQVPIPIKYKKSFISSKITFDFRKSMVAPVASSMTLNSRLSKVEPQTDMYSLQDPASPPTHRFHNKSEHDIDIRPTNPFLRSSLPDPIPAGVEPQHPVMRHDFLAKSLDLATMNALINK